MSLEQLKDKYVYMVDRLTLLMDMAKPDSNHENLKKAFFEAYQSKAIDYLTQIDASYTDTSALFNLNHKLQKESPTTKTMHASLNDWIIPIYRETDPNPDSELQGADNMFTKYKQAFSEYLTALVNNVRQNSDKDSKMIPLLTTGIQDLIKTTEAFKAAELSKP